MKEKLIAAGVKNLHEFGYPQCTADNILTDRAVRGLQALRIVLGIDSPETRGWAPVVQQEARQAIDRALTALTMTPVPWTPPSAWDASKTKETAMQKMIEVSATEANNYSRILTLLGMDEEGDPVAEITHLKEAMEEATEILDTYIGNVQTYGNYSKETTLVFLGQVRQCLSNP